MASGALRIRGAVLMIAALYVQTGGCYFGLPDVDPWDEARDARLYAGPWPVVAHPPCQRWGRFWHGGPSAPHTRKFGDDGGCFRAAISSVRQYGGVLEHPADSGAWAWFGITKPKRGAGWHHRADQYGGATCYVEQGNYGHFARKGTWLYVVGCDLPKLNWTIGAQRLDAATVARLGYVKARRTGAMALIGGKDKTKIREATPIEFRDLLISIAESAGVP